MTEETLSPKTREKLTEITKRFNPDIPYKTELNLKLPKQTKLQKEILEIAKKENAIITGSFAQQALVKGSRKFKDIDIVTTRVKILARKIKKTLGDKIKAKEVIIKSPQGKFSIIRIFSKRTGKLIADIDPKRFAEEGKINEFGTQEVEGLKLINVRARLQAKIAQLQRGKTKRGKIARDIMQLTANPLARKIKKIKQKQILFLKAKKSKDLMIFKTRTKMSNNFFAYKNNVKTRFI